MSEHKTIRLPQEESLSLELSDAACRVVLRYQQPCRSSSFVAEKREELSGVWQVSKYVKKTHLKEIGKQPEKQYQETSLFVQKHSELKILNASIADNEDFDVFISYNSKDKIAVRHIVQKFNEKRLRYWFDDEEIRPGSEVIQALQEAMEHAKSAAIFIGTYGPGPWQNEEVQSFLRDKVDKKIHVIPVLLPSVLEIPKELKLLRNLKWINFRHADDEEALNKLIWGITGKKSPRKPHTR